MRIQSERRCGLTVLREVPLSQFVFLDLEATLEELFGSIATDRHVTGNLLVPLDAEGSDGVLGLRLDGLLAGEILKHLSSLGEFIARLTSAQVQDELINNDSSHLVIGLGRVLL